MASLVYLLYQKGCPDEEANSFHISNFLCCTSVSVTSCSSLSIFESCESPSCPNADEPFTEVMRRDFVVRDHQPEFTVALSEVCCSQLHKNVEEKYGVRKVLEVEHA